jgi:anti-sigma factor RsiW
MTNYCLERKDSLLEAALSDAPEAALQDHLQKCPGCREQLATLRARRTRMESALPLIAQGPEPSVEFHARVMQAATVQKPQPRMSLRNWFTLSRRRWAPAIPVLAVVAVAAVLLAAKQYRKRTADEELAAASRLANWQSPTASLLQTPGQELLRGTPRIGETYFNISAPTQREKQP